MILNKRVLSLTLVTKNSEIKTTSRHCLLSAVVCLIHVMLSGFVHSPISTALSYAVCLLSWCPNSLLWYRIIRGLVAVLLKAIKEKKILWSPWKQFDYWQLLWHWPRRGVRAKCDGPTPFIVGHLPVTFNSRRLVLPADAHTEAENTVWASSVHAGIWKGDHWQGQIAWYFQSMTLM